MRTGLTHGHLGLHLGAHLQAPADRDRTEACQPNAVTLRTSRPKKAGNAGLYFIVLVLWLRWVARRAIVE